MLMKNDSYQRFLRSDYYKEVQQSSSKKKVSFSYKYKLLTIFEKQKWKISSNTVLFYITKHSKINTFIYKSQKFMCPTLYNLEALKSVIFRNHLLVFTFIYLLAIVHVNIFV
jgi:hypothetical protein